MGIEWPLRRFTRGIGVKCFLSRDCTSRTLMNKKKSCSRFSSDYGRTGQRSMLAKTLTDSAFVEIPFEVELLKGENDVRISGVTLSKVALDCLKVTKL